MVVEVLLGAVERDRGDDALDPALDQEPPARRQVGLRPASRRLAQQLHRRSPYLSATRLVLLAGDAVLVTIEPTVVVGGRPAAPLSSFEVAPA